MLSFKLPIFRTDILSSQHNGLIGDTVVLRDLAGSIALLNAAEHIRPLFGGNTILWVCRAGATLLACL